MENDPLKRTLEPLVREPLAPVGDVSAWVMRDVARLRRPAGESPDRLTLWAAAFAAAAAIVVGVITFEPARRMLDGDALADLSHLDAFARADVADLEWN